MDLAITFVDPVTVSGSSRFARKSAHRSPVESVLSGKGSRDGKSLTTQGVETNSCHAAWGLGSAVLDIANPLRGKPDLPSDAGGPPASFFESQDCVLPESVFFHVGTLRYPIDQVQRDGVTVQRADVEPPCENVFMDLETVGRRIKWAREQKGLTRPKLSKMAKIPYSTLAGLENGDQQTSTFLPVLAEHLGVSALWLASGRGFRSRGEELTAPQPALTEPTRLEPTSQRQAFDKDTLTEALMLLHYDESVGGTYPVRVRADRLEELYRWVERDGGRLSSSSNAEFVHQVQQRSRQVSNERDGERGRSG